MSESLPKTYSRFYAFIISTNLAIFLLLAFWLWQYWHDGLIASVDVDSFFNRRVSFSILNKYVFEPYILDSLLVLAIAFLGLGSLVSIITKKLAIAYAFLSIHSVVVFITCVLIQSKIDVLHIWRSALVSASVITCLSGNSRREQENENQDFDKTFLSVMQIICLLLFMLNVFSY
ncbi:hypothetical protein [Leptolyngbya sp. FACHB-711]|uniref:hypothetical protein n=1 Tax=unclassified Leptolyngbya TaxID=2650499 RepID=UPI001682D67F|nr:hypothetical protein [Leptolyngbya sp. FACHB-711]MBD1853038.1 hypothetical protein [Cyanobacteria bacterium FACHB-502]MBD2024619.1 hypothetical protein [Leptolyngbya sp. FACHB-711]